MLNIRTPAGDLLRDDRGAVTAEFTVLVPFFILTMVFFADVCVLFLTHTEMYNTSREISRRMSTGELRTASDVRDYAERKLFLGSRNYEVAVDFSGTKEVTIAIDLGDAAFFGAFLKPLLGRALVAVSGAGSEPEVG